MASHSGRTTSSISRRTLRRISSTSGGNVKSIMTGKSGTTPSHRADSALVSEGAASESGAEHECTSEPLDTVSEEVTRTSRAAWDADELPQGNDKVEAVRQ